MSSRRSDGFMRAGWGEEASARRFLFTWYRVLTLVNGFDTSHSNSGRFAVFEGQTPR